MGVSLARLDSLYKPDTFDDTLSAASITGLEGSAVDFADFQEGYLSQIKRILHGDDAGNWHDSVTTEFSRNGSLKSLASKTPLDEKLTLRWKLNTTNLTAVATDAQHILLDTADEPPSSVIAIATSVKGACSAQLAGAVDTAGLDEIAGSNPLSPKNLVAIFSADSGDPILSGGRRVWGLLQVGSAATDGNSFATSGDDLGQISFVRANSTYDDLELTPVGDMDAEVIIYAYSVRNDLDSTSEDEFRGGIAQADPVQGVTVTLDNAYDGGNYITADASDIDFRLSDTVSFIVKKAGGNAMFTVIRTDAGTADEVIIGSDVDTFDVNASVNDFANGVTVDSGTQSINVGVTASGVIDSASAELRANSGNAKISAASGELQFVSSRQASLPLDDATAGAISALSGGPHASVSAAIAHAMTIGGADLELKLFTAGSNYARDANIPAATFDLSTHSIDMNTISGVDTLIFLNGDLKVGGNVTTQNDVYVGDTAADGDLKFDLAKGIHSGDVILSVALQQ
jgi:hypothetical protein